MKRNAVAWAALVVSVGALVGSRGNTKPATAVQEIPAEGQKVARNLSEAFGAVAEFASPSVVQISVQKKGGIQRILPFGGPGQGKAPENGNAKELEDMLKEMLKRFPNAPKFEKEQFEGPQGTGSGFVYDDRGHILTNNHVVSDAEKITVTFNDGETASAKVVGADPRSDVAVIQVDNTSYRPLPKGNSSKLKVGEWVIAVGAPFGLNQSVTAGIISATERDAVGINEYESFIQTDAAVNPGNSGGPLIDMNGRVVGINSAIATMTRSSAGVGFAIPIEMASALADKLIKDGKVSRTRVGIRLEANPVTPGVAKKLGLDRKTHGVIVAEVVDDSPAAKAGIKAGDVITAFDGHAVHSLAGFRNLVSASDAGKSYDIKYLRKGTNSVASIQPASESQVVFNFEREKKQPDRVARSPRANVEAKDYGLTLEALTPELAEKNHYPKGTTGLIVADVKKNSAAAYAGLEKNDVITQVIKDEQIQPVLSPKDVFAAADKSNALAVFVKDCNNPGDKAQLLVIPKTVPPSASPNGDDD